MEAKKIRKEYIFGLLLTFIFIYPIVISPVLFDGVGIGDWEHIRQRFAAIYITYFKFHQLPGNNIWIGGGIPLLQIFPGYGLTGFATLMVGPVTGIYLSVMIYYLIGYVGAIKLAGLFTKQIKIQLFFALYTVFGNALAWHLTVGHVLFANILLFPLILFYLLNCESKFSGAKAGFLCGAAFLDNMAFTAHYFLLSVGVLLLFFTLTKQKKRMDITIFIIQFFSVYITVIFFRLYMIFPIVADFAGNIASRPKGVSFGSFDFIKFSVAPYFELQSHVTTAYCHGIWENANYISITALLVIIYAAIRKNYLYITPIIFLFIAYSNDSSPLDLNYYLNYLPTFSSLSCTARIRMLSPYVIGLCLIIFISGKGVISPFNIKFNQFIIDKLKKIIPLVWGEKRKLYQETIFNVNITTLLMLVILVEVYVASTAAFLQSHKYDGKLEYSWSDNFQNYNNLPASIYSTYQATLSNIGIINSNDSHLSSVRVGVGKEDGKYISEYTQNKKPITPVYWSPNIIIFKTNDLKNCIQSNIPIGNLWTVNGNDIFANRKFVETDKLICAYPNENGDVELRWGVRSGEIGIIINIAILISALILLFITNKYSGNRKINS